MIQRPGYEIKIQHIQHKHLCVQSQKKSRASQASQIETEIMMLFLVSSDRRSLFRPS